MNELLKMMRTFGRRTFGSAKVRAEQPGGPAPTGVLASLARPASVLVGFIAIGAAVAAVVPRPVALPLTEPAIDPRVANKVTSFASDHPEFAPLRDGRKDATGIKFPHAAHFEFPKISAKDWKGVDRRLECLDCHLPESDGRYMLPVTFEQHCAACHSLGQIEVAEGVVKPAPTPHGDEGEIAAVVNAQVFEWVAMNASKGAAGAEKPAEEAKPAAGGGGRRGRGGAAEAPKKAELQAFKSPDELDTFLIDQRDKVFKDLAKGTKCGYCHTVDKADTKGSPFVVKNPKIPDQWLTRSVFSHAAHAMVSCASCHAAEASTSAADINLPNLNSCRECHSPRTAGEQAMSVNGAGDSCVLCHVYHPKNAAPMEGKLKPADLLRE
ncbi:MAG: cytochrome c3 family protein [Phycisphaerales bacterium]